MITNNVYKKTQLTEYWVTTKGLFSDVELNNICNYCEKENQRDAEIIGSKDESIRKSKVSFHNIKNDNSWIFERLNFAIEELNNYFYNFELYGYDAFQFTTYYSSTNDFYNFHTDTVFGSDKPFDMKNTRKLSGVLLLSEPEKDFSGGEFEIFLHGKIPLEKGQLIVFPSFIAHKVNVVTSGVRKSLVFWVEGPKFR